MQQRIKKFSIVSLLFMMLAGSFTMNGAVFAQESETGGASGSGLRVTPTRSELSLTDGETTSVTQTVRNVTQSPVTVQPSLNDFESDGVSGQPKLIGDPNDISIHSLREFVKLPGDFDLQPDEERSVTVDVTVPQGATPGAYFGSVLYRAVPVGASNSGQVALVASVGSLILLEVPGDITEQISINNISAYLGEKKGSLFTSKPDKVGLTIENLGNGFAKPFGKVSVNDWRGKTIFEYELNDPDKRKNVLPESSRLFLQELFDVEEKTVNGELQQTKTSPIKMPGKYKIVGNISHGTTGEVFTVSSTFWYLPAWLLIGLAIIVVLIVGSAFYFFRRYNDKSLRRKK